LTGAIAPLSDFSLWARGSLPVIVLLILGAVLLTRLANWADRGVPGRARLVRHRAPTIRTRRAGPARGQPHAGAVGPVGQAIDRSPVVSVPLPVVSVPLPIAFDQRIGVREPVTDPDAHAIRPDVATGHDAGLQPGSFDDAVLGDRLSPGTGARVELR
jgi:hypothetical protein